MEQIKSCKVIIGGIDNWINSQPLTMQGLRGKVVLVDFWTYTCINCIRTLPHVKRWHEKYRTQGLVVVGVHTPEYPFERSTSNVQSSPVTTVTGAPMASPSFVCSCATGLTSMW